IPETKNGKPHTIYLSALAQQIIAEQKSGEFVFESVRSADQPILPSSITRALNRLQERALPDLEPFTVHDLRRSAATNWAEHLGAEERVIEICLNHQPMNKLIRIYHRSKHEDKTRALWQAWGEMVEEQVAR
ncbi:MAG: tyrosine-type recombinase/integrase, partial [Plesiomonas sp.]